MGTQPVVVITPPDPYVSHLIRSDLPEATVFDMPVTASVQDVMGCEPDVVIATMGGSVLLDALSERTDRPPIVAIVEAVDRGTQPVPEQVGDLVLRPIIPIELQRAVRQAIGQATVSGERELAPSRSWLSLLLACAVLIAAVVQAITATFDARRLAVLAVVAVYTLAGLRRARTGSLLVWLDSAVAAAALAATGSDVAYLAYAMLVCFESGLVLGLRALFVGAIVALGSLVGFASAGADIRLDAGSLVAWTTLFPLTSLVGGYMRRLTVVPDDRVELLKHTRRVLAELYRDARMLPESLDARHALRTAVGSLSGLDDLACGVVLRHELGMLTEADSFASEGWTPVIFVPGDLAARRLLDSSASLVARQTLPEALRERFAPFDQVIAAPMRADDTVHGIILAAPADGGNARAVAAVAKIADELAFALDSARLFERVRDLSVDEDRRRIATELHDGLAQQLTHLRLELTHLSRHGTSLAAVRKECEELSREVSEALADVRGTIYGLTGSSLPGSFVAAISSYLREVRALGTAEIVFRARGAVYLPPETEVEIFGLVRGVVEGLLRAENGRFSVVMEGKGRGVLLTVSAGAGAEPDLEDLKRRAREVGADLRAEAGPDGLIVRLSVDLDEGEPPMQRPATTS